MTGTGVIYIVVAVAEGIAVIALAAFNYRLGRRHGIAEGRLQALRDQTGDGRSKEKV